MEKVCKRCKRLVKEGNECPVCGSKDLTTSWSGLLVVYDPESEIAKKVGITSPGRYAIRIRM